MIRYVGLPPVFATVESTSARLLVHALGGEAYLNFEGNEFGHPEVAIVVSLF
jgi:hypothetical protein